jgi:hypothetical protein
MRKVLLILVIAAVSLLALVGLAVVGLVGLFLIVPEQPTLDVRVNAPETVPMGKEFDLVLHTRNLHDEPIRLDSIDVDLAFLEGFEVVSVDPTPSDVMDFLGQRCWSFADTVSPGEGLDVTYRLKAVQPGHYAGDMDVCNPAQDFTTVVPNVEVMAK